MKPKFDTIEGRSVLVTGGARSGKSRFSEGLVLQSEGNPFYIATCPVLDDETADRVRRHRLRHRRSVRRLRCRRRCY